MSHLERINGDTDTSLYAIRGDDSPLRRYVVTTPESRGLCNRPDIMGIEFVKAMTAAASQALELLPERPAIVAHPEQRVCVVHFLRGGLNFGLKEALNHAYDFNLHSSCFISSQRRKVDGRWQVEEDMYRKLRIPADAILMMGDVVATGTTVANGLQVILEHLQHIGSTVRRVLFVTIGCGRLDEVLEEQDARYQEAFAEYEGTSAVYLEGRFRLVADEDELRIGHAGTDLIRRDCLVAPEFALSQYERLSHPLERCVIYDAGSRAFDIPTYMADVRGYWGQVHDLGLAGMTLGEALEERWPEPWHGDRAAFDAAAKGQWPDADPELLEKIWQRVADRWTDHFRREADRAGSLVELAEGRLGELPVVER